MQVKSSTTPYESCLDYDRRQGLLETIVDLDEPLRSLRHKAAARDA
jgi:hypothetical protein